MIAERLERSPQPTDQFSQPPPGQNGILPDNISYIHQGVQPPSVLRSLASLESPFGLKTSHGENFEHGIYSSDMMRATGDQIKAFIMFAPEKKRKPINPQDPLKVIDTMVRYQAPADNPASDAKKGDIVHELRTMQMIEDSGVTGEKRDKAVAIFQKLSSMWGGNEKSVAYYGRQDINPNSILFIDLYRQYQQQYFKHYPEGTDLPKEDVLDRKVVQESGQEITVKESMKLTFGSMTDSIFHSDLGLREFKWNGPNSMLTQNWRDSATGLIHENGEQVNRGTMTPENKERVAEVATQGFTYAAYKIGSEIFSRQEMQEIASSEAVLGLLKKSRVKELFSKGEYEVLARQLVYDDADTFSIIAKIIQKQVISRFWMEDKQFFASGIDRDPETKEIRQVRTEQSNPGELLGLGFFDDMPEGMKYTRAIAKKLVSPSFMTDAGVRCRSIDNHGVVDFSDYHGDEVEWPQADGVFLAGFINEGLIEIAKQEAYRIVNPVNISGRLSEFNSVLMDGRVIYDVTGERDHLLHKDAEVVTYVTTNKAEDDQAFTDGAVLLAKIFLAHADEFVQDPNSLQAELDQELVASVPYRKPLKTKQEIAAAFPRDTKFVFDLEEGKKRDSKYNPAWWKEQKKHGKVTTLYTGADIAAGGD